MSAYRLLADLVVFVHIAYVAVIVLGLAFVLVGYFRGWRWVRGFWFRSIHLTMIAVVVFEAVFGVTCPLTTLESDFRQKAGQSHHDGSFLGYWAYELLFYEAPPWVFTVIYCTFGSLVLATFLLVPPRWPWTRETEAATNS